MKQNIFKTIDSLSFKYIDKLKSSSQYKKFIGSFISIDLELQELIFRLASFLFYALPITIVALMISFNVKKSNEFSIKNQIYENSRNYLINKNKVQQKIQKFAAKENFQNKNQLIEKIKSNLNQVKIPTTNIRITSFNKSNVYDINQVKANLSFSKLNNVEFLTLIDMLKNKFSMKISSFNLKRDKDDYFQGNLNLLFLNK